MRSREEEVRHVPSSFVPFFYHRLRIAIDDTGRREDLLSFQIRRGLGWDGEGPRGGRQQRCQNMCSDPIRYAKLRTEWPSRAELLGILVHFGCRPQRYLPPSLASYAQHSAPDFRRRRRPTGRPRETVKSDSDLLEAESGFIRSDPIERCLRCPPAPAPARPKCVGDDGSNYCISHGPRRLWHSGRSRDLSLAVHLSRSFLRRFFCSSFFT